MKAEAPVLELFKSLTGVPTAPYFERAVTGKALAWIKERLGRSVSVKRRRGGVVVRYEGAGPGPALGLAAHLDHPAFRLSAVSALGAHGQMEGGLPIHLLAGVAVEAFSEFPKGNRPLARGILGERPKEGSLFDIRWTQPPARGAKPVFAIPALTPYEVKAGWLSSRSIDDLLGCAISLEVVRRLAKARAQTNVVVLLHRAEEVGFMGALDLIEEGAVSKQDSILSIESSRELPGAQPGKGAVIRLGDKACLFDANLTALLDAAAAKLKGVPVQRLRLTGGTCEATAYLAYGYEAGGVAVPLVNYHNGWGADAVAPERVRVSDIGSAVRLLEAAALLFPAAGLRGGLHARLKKRHQEQRRRFAPPA
ncbi:MAG: M20/M25/M40 family metallo-hydrolase [Elusimicrobiota bacterium]